jgi:hypothetical protein
MAYVKKIDIPVCENQTLSFNLSGIYSRVHNRILYLAETSKGLTVIILADLRIQNRHKIIYMELKSVFDRLWKDYSDQNPSVRKICELFTNEGEEVVNDHIAFRTIDLPEVNIDVIARPFTSAGYVERGKYLFNEKHLFARHFENPADEKAPRVFISQLILKECSSYIRETFNVLMRLADHMKFDSGDLIFSGTFFNPLSYETYCRLREASEYAAWFYVFGFRANHFTVSINYLKKYNDILKVNELLKKNGYILNNSGGEIKGTPADLLQQSSTMADIISVDFIEGSYEIPSCYYEFAQRYAGTDGKLYGGFNATSADKIFESTHFYKRKKPR